MFRFGKKFGKTQAWIKSIWTYGFVFGPYSVLIHRLVCSTQVGFRTFTLTITKEVWEKTKFTPNYKEIGKNKTLEMLPFENSSHWWKVNTTFKERAEIRERMKRNFGKITNATTDQLVTLTLQRVIKNCPVFFRHWVKMRTKSYIYHSKRTERGEWTMLNLTWEVRDKPIFLFLAMMINAWSLSPLHIHND